MGCYARTKFEQQIYTMVTKRCKKWNNKVDTNFTKISNSVYKVRIKLSNISWPQYTEEISLYQAIGSTNACSFSLSLTLLGWADNESQDPVRCGFGRIFTKLASKFQLWLSKLKTCFWSAQTWDWYQIHELGFLNASCQFATPVQTTHNLQCPPSIKLAQKIQVIIPQNHGIHP